MPGGLMSVGRSHRQNADRAFSDVATMERRNARAEERMERAEDQQRTNAVGTGAGIGASVGGPWGAVIGAAVGLLGSELF